MGDNNEIVEDKYTLDYVIRNEIGGMGKFQIMTILMVTIPSIFNGFMVGDFLFTSGRLTHRCAVPECDDTEPDYAPVWINNAIPPSATSDIHDCLRFVPLNNTNPNGQDTCPVSLFDTNQTVACESYVYGSTNTAVYDFGLECQEWIRNLANLAVTLGSLIGLPITSYISDQWGRRTIIILCAFFMGSVGLIRAFSINHAMYLAFQFLATALGSGAFSGGYIIATEIVGPEYRVPTGAAVSTSIAVGRTLLGIIAWSIRPWRTLTLVLHTPAFLMMIYYWIFPESVRWLLARRKYERANLMLRKMARINGKTISEESLSALTSPKVISENIKCEADLKKPQERLLSRVVHSSIMLRRCCTTPIWWISTTCIYYGLSINAVSLSGNGYFNYSATVAVEIPGFWTAVLLLNRIGRRLTIFSGFLLSAVCCFIFTFLPNHLTTLSIIIYLLGKFGISAVMTSIYLYTSELYPTCDRHKFLAFSSTIGRLGTILASFTPPLMEYWVGIPPVLFGTLALISALLVLTQPETLGTKLPDTFAEAESIGKTKS